MSDRIIIQCPGCSAKLAISDASKLGKKIKCSKCSEVFVASAMSSGSAKASKPTKPASKLKKSDQDEFDLDDMEMEDFSNSEDEEFESEAPARSSKRSGKKAGAVKGKAKGKGKKQSDGNLPLMIGGAVAVVLLIGGGLWLLMGGKNEPVPVAQQAAPPSSDPAAASTPASFAASSNTVTASPASVGKFPRAMTELPDWLVKDAPFDVNQFWITVPPSENAAPLYLDALYEFVPEMEACFAPEVRSQRTATAKTRHDRSLKLQIQWSNPQQPKDATERDAVLQEHVSPFQKLEEAQKRPQCVFEIGWDAPSFLPPIHAFREVVRVAQLQVERDIERGDFDSVLRMTNLTLRLSRDIRSRTPMVMQDVATALESLIISQILIPALKSPALKTSQCDDLLRQFVLHEAAVRKTNLFLTGLRGDYIWKRMLLHDVQQQTGEFAEARFREAFGVSHETRAAAMLTALNGTSDQLKALGTETPNPQLSLMFDLFLSAMKPGNYDAEVLALKDKYQVLSSAITEPYAVRSKAFAQLREKYQKGLQAQLADVQIPPPPNTPPEQAMAQMKVALEKKLAAGTLRGPFLAAFLINGSKLENDMGQSGADVTPMTRLEGAKSLVALRRWYGTHGNPPPDFATMCREAGLTDLPRDYFSDGPLRMVTFAAETPIQHRYQKYLKAMAGETIVYSFGPDGVDDKALKDWGYVDPGDFLFRMEIPQSEIPATPAPPATRIVIPQ